jgi:hypothetical protein
MLVRTTRMVCTQCAIFGADARPNWRPTACILHRPHDLLVIVEAPNGENVAKFALALSLALSVLPNTSCPTSLTSGMTLSRRVI